MDSPLALFSEGHFGNAGFMLVGMAQIRHARAGSGRSGTRSSTAGEWGWLAEAQGRYYLTFEDEARGSRSICARSRRVTRSICRCAARRTR